MLRGREIDKVTSRTGFWVEISAKFSKNYHVIVVFEIKSELRMKLR